MSREAKVKKTWKFAAAAAILTALSISSAFAETRHRNETNRDSRYESRGQSMTMEGRVRSVERDRDGYRVQLDRGDYRYYVPRSAMRNWRGNDLRVGVSLRVVGIFDGSYVHVSSADFLGYGNDDHYRGGRDQRYGYNDEAVRGIVESVDFRRGTLLLRDDRSGRRVSVFMAGGNRGRRGVDLNDLRRGDVITLSGDWHRNSVFEAYRIESLRSGRR